MIDRGKRVGPELGHCDSPCQIHPCILTLTHKQLYIISLRCSVCCMTYFAESVSVSWLLSKPNALVNAYTTMIGRLSNAAELRRDGCGYMKNNMHV